MSQVIASPAADAAPSNIIALRDAVGDTVKRQYGATREYAVALCDWLPADWFEVEHTSLREEDKPVLAEAKAFRAALKAAGHKNPSVMWTRVRDAAREYIYPTPAKGEGEEGEGGEGGEGKNKGAKPQRSLQLRLIEDLSSLWKACQREEGKTTAQQNAQTSITTALAALGIDTSTLVK